jgi:predicted nicotinamide N-methyase
MAHVTVTDGDTDALVQLRNNINTNRCNGNISAVQLLWGIDTAKAFLEAHGNGDDENSSTCSFDVILASDIIYAAAIIDPLWETIRILLSYPDGIFWMAFARRKVPVTIDFVLNRAKDYGFCYELAAESESIEDEQTNREAVDLNPEIDDAAGANEVYIYVFKWDTTRNINKK